MKKKVLTIVIIVAVLAGHFVVFSASYDLKNIFLTRDEWESFESSMSAVLSNIERNKQSSVQVEVGYQMYRRDILSRSVVQSMQSDSAGRATLDSWSERRSRELSEGTSSIAPPSP